MQSDGERSGRRHTVEQPVGFAWIVDALLGHDVVLGLELGDLAVDEPQHVRERRQFGDDAERKQQHHEVNHRRAGAPGSS